MKILITTDWYKPVINGVVTSVLNLQQALSEKGHEVRVVTLSQDFTSRKEGNVYFLKSVNMNRIYPYARASCFLEREYFEEILSWEPDVVHSQCEFSSFYIAKKIASILEIPIVHTYHTVYEDYTHYFASNTVWSKKLVACFSRRITNRSQSVIVPTEKVRNLLLGYGTTTQINVVPSGIDLEKYNRKVSQEEIDILKIQLGIPQGDKVLVTLGRLAREKNVEELIQYFSKLNRRDISFVIVGDGPFRHELEQQARNCGVKDKIFFTGMVPPWEVPLYYKLGDVFLCASNSETQGITYIEAMASGLPVVCRKDECVADIVINGSNGYQYQSFEQFENQVSQILSNDETHQAMKKKAQEAADVFSVTKFAEKVESVYYNEIIKCSENSGWRKKELTIDKRALSGV